MSSTSLSLITKITKLSKAAVPAMSSTGVLLLLSLFVGMYSGYKLSSVYYANKEVERQRAQIQLMTERLRVATEVATKYRTSELNYKYAYENFLKSANEDPPSSNAVLPARRVQRLNGVR